MDYQRANISALRALHPRIANRFDPLVADLIKNHLIGSTLVEGSTFTEDQARAVLAGTVIHGHTVDEHKELINGREAASLMMRLFFEASSISTKDIGKVHFVLFDGVGDPKKKIPGKNRGQNGNSAFTYTVENEHPIRIEYEHPARIKTDYQRYLDYHVNRELSDSRNEAVMQLVKMYFHFEMLHPYNDGNGRLGRLLVCGKAAVDKAWFFHFEAKDGPEHLRAISRATLQHTRKQAVDYSELESFFASHIKEYD